MSNQIDYQCLPCSTAANPNSDCILCFGTGTMTMRDGKIFDAKRACQTCGGGGAIVRIGNVIRGITCPDCAAKGDPVRFGIVKPSEVLPGSTEVAPGVLRNGHVRDTVR